jgi:hypothetical protein
MIIIPPVSIEHMGTQDDMASIQRCMRITEQVHPDSGGGMEARRQSQKRTSPSNGVSSMFGNTKKLDMLHSLPHLLEVSIDQAPVFDGWNAQ